MAYDPSPTPRPVSDQAGIEMQRAILAELQTISTLLQVGLSVRDDPASLREEFSRAAN